MTLSNCLAAHHVACGCRFCLFSFEFHVYARVRANLTGCDCHVVRALRTVLLCDVFCWGCPDRSQPYTISDILFARRSVVVLLPTTAGKAEEEVGESDEPDLTASADLEDSR